MPKAKPFIVTAKHEPTGLLEHIAIHNTHKFDDVGKPRRIVHPTIKPLIRRPFNPERAETVKHDIEELALRAHLFKKQQLLNCISDPAPPLIYRIDMQAGPSYEYEPPKPLPNIHFQHTKILLRTSEYNKMFAATADRLEPVFAQMEKEEGSLEPEVVAKVRRMGDGFDELYHGLEKKSLLREVESLHITVQNQQALVDSYKRQVDALPASTGSGHSRQPKIGEPPAFKGSEDKTKLEKWLDLIVLWCEHEGVATDKQRIVTALSKLQGPAHQYMKSYYVKMREGKDLGTWKAFVAELAQIYGQRDDKEGAKKEITVLFINKDLASKDFVKYAERFRTLGRLMEYDDSLLIDKLREVIPRDMRLVLAGKDESTLPKDWTLFLDILLNINKIVNPEKARGSVFKNSGLDNGGAVPMDIDSAEKSKSKGKGKGKAKDAEAASTEAKKYCVICKSKTHNTDDCYKLAKNADKRPKTQGDGTKKAQGGSGNPAAKKAKKTRVIQVELTDSEDDTPPSTKAVSANTARIEEIANVEESTLAGKDEPQLSAKTEPTAATSDFWKKYM
ncbi:predicted protein [Postia placenta Mad-698-R]|nr:predicted protein [Postia placenta Mad-698-R]